MRYQCDIPGFEDNFIELSERWTRRELATVDTIEGEAYFALLRRKLTGVHLTRIDEETGNAIDPIDTPAGFTREATEAIDFMVWRWVAHAMRKGINTLYSLGEERARRWSRAQETTTVDSDKPA
jgi:hypothetical protein